MSDRRPNLDPLQGRPADYERTTQHAQPPLPHPHGNGARVHILITIASLFVLGISGMVLTEYRVGAIERHNEISDERAAKRDDAIAALAATQGRILERVSTNEREIDRLRAFQNGGPATTKRIGH